MKTYRNSFFNNDLTLLILLALARLILHTATNGQYGFHRDELAMLDDAWHLAWGYVAYPPLVPFLTRLGWELFGAALPGLRLFSVVVQCVAMVLVGLMAKELGGGRGAQVVAALAAAIAPMSLIMGAMFQYISFDYFWWVLIGYCMIRRITSGDPRWWIGMGAAIGLGMMTKYTIIFLIAGVIVAVLLTPLQRDLKSPWLWAGAALSIVICLPALLWQAQHQFISLEFLSSIHARDVAIGRADGFIWQQFVASTNPFTVPLWVAGLVYFFSKRGEKYRASGWMFVVPAVLLGVSRGRFYYLAPAFPVLLASGAVVWTGWLSERARTPARVGWGFTGIMLVVGAVIGGMLMLPIHAVGSPGWDFAYEVHDNFAEMIGWPELVAEVAEIYEAQPEGTGILAANYGEAGAVALYGPDYGLPTPISGMNSFWARGYGNPPPERVIVLGFEQEALAEFFETCVLTGNTPNPLGVENEETLFHPEIFVCEGLKLPWEVFWEEMRRFG